MDPMNVEIGSDSADDIKEVGQEFDCIHLADHPGNASFHSKSEQDELKFLRSRSAEHDEEIAMIRGQLASLREMTQKERQKHKDQVEALEAERDCLQKVC